jgi:hypothetical protein
MEEEVIEDIDDGEEVADQEVFRVGDRVVTVNMGDSGMGRVNTSEVG